MLIPDIFYVQSQFGKVPQNSLRIQANLLFVVPRSGGTASKESGGIAVDALYLAIINSL
jgi:hypothetical protein